MGQRDRSGRPEDPDLSIIAFQSPDGRPLAVLANFGMHYYSDEPISADYYGLFCEGMQSRLGKDGAAPLAIMSHGCSGDMWLCDYEKPPGQRNEKWTIDSYTEQLLDIAMKAYATITYQDADLAMAETRLHLPYRVPDQQRLEWAQRIMAEMGDRPPANSSEVYAREQIYLHERQAGDVVLQAIRIGNILIAATPTETYALTGLKIKRQSPLPQTMVLDLANGSDGYLPPPEQHGVGGYNTWPARSSCLEVRAEPKIAEASVELLEKVAGRSRRVFTQSRGPAAAAILAAQPAAYWRLDEWEAPRAADISGHRRDGIYEPGVVFFLPGPRGDAFCTGGEENRAAHFCGGRLRGRIDGLTDRYTVSLWFWNGMPLKARPVTGWLFSRGHDHGRGPYDDHLGIDTAGKLIFQRGDGTGEDPPAIGRTAIERWTWNHAVLVRDGKNIRVYLNGNPQPEIETTLSADFPAGLDQVFLGGRCDNDSNWEGRLDEIAVFTAPFRPRRPRDYLCGRGELESASVVLTMHRAAGTRAERWSWRCDLRALPTGRQFGIFEDSGRAPTLRWRRVVEFIEHRHRLIDHRFPRADLQFAVPARPGLVAAVGIRPAVRYVANVLVGQADDARVPEG